jgi:hypothetical protein
MVDGNFRLSHTTSVLFLIFFQIFVKIKKINKWWKFFQKSPFPPKIRGSFGEKTIE